MLHNLYIARLVAIIAFVVWLRCGRDVHVNEGQSLTNEDGDSTLLMQVLKHSLIPSVAHAEEQSETVPQLRHPCATPTLTMKTVAVPSKLTCSEYNIIFTN